MDLKRENKKLMKDNEFIKLTSSEFFDKNEKRVFVDISAIYIKIKKLNNRKALQ